MEKYPTCEERIGEQLEREMNRIREALGEHDEPIAYTHYCDECGYEWDSDEEYEHCPDCDDGYSCGDPVEEERETHDSYMEGVLEITPLHIVYRVGLSWGGPADGFYLYVDPDDHTIEKIEYYFQDWFDGATRTLAGSEFDLVRDMFESYIEIAEYERTHK